MLKTVCRSALKTSPKIYSIMALGFEFCLSKSNSKSSKQRAGAVQQQPANNANNGINGSNRNSQHSLNHRDHHTTPTSTTASKTTAPPTNTHQTLLPQNEMDHNNSNLYVTGIRHVTEKFHSEAPDELTVGPGDICVFEFSDNDDQGKNWSHVLCLTQNNARGFVPSRVLSIYTPDYLAQYKKKLQRTDHLSNTHLHTRRHHHHSQRHHLEDLNCHHQHNHHNHGQHHTSGVTPTVMSNAAAVGHHIGRMAQCEMNKIGQCISEKTCPSNGDSIRYPPSGPVDLHNHLVAPPQDHHQSRLDMHPNLLQGSSSGCQTFQKYPEPAFPLNHFDPASYYNLNGPPPVAEPPYDSFRSKCIPFRRDEPGDLYVVMFNFVHREERDISVKPGDYVNVLNKDDLNWYWVRREEDHLEGFVPARFIVPNDKAESILNKGNSTVTMKSSNAIDVHTYINSNPVPDRDSLQTDQQSLPPCQPVLTLQ